MWTSSTTVVEPWYNYTNIRICEIFRCRGIRETLTALGSSGTKRLLTFLTLIFWHEEKETHFLLWWLFQHRSSVNPQLTVRPRVKISTRLAQSQISTNCFFFKKSLKFPAPRFRAWRHSHPSPTWGFYYDICDCHILRARAWKPALRAE